MKVKRTTDYFNSYHGDFDYNEDDPEVLVVKNDTALSGRNIRLYTDKIEYYTITAEEFRYYLRTRALIILDKEGKEV